MPVELGLELMASVGAYLLDTEGERLHYVIREIDGAGLSVALVYFQRAHPRHVVNRRVLLPLDLLPLFSLEDQELDVQLDMMARHLLAVSLRVHLSQSRPARQAVQSMALEGAIGTCIGDFDGRIALQLPDNPDRSEMILAPEVKDLLFDFSGHFIWMIMWHKTGDEQASLTLVCLGLAPSIKARSPNPDIATCLAHVTDRIGMLQNPKFTVNLSLIAVH
jgi:hypothetical protein